MVQSGFDGFFSRNTLRAYWKSQYLTELTDDASDVIAGRALDRPMPLASSAVWQMGGAIGATAVCVGQCQAVWHRAGCT